MPTLVSARSLVLGILAAAGLLAGSGCGGAGLKTYPVNGIVTLDDKPVGGALVRFMPTDDPGRGRHDDPGGGADQPAPE